MGRSLPDGNPPSGVASGYVWFDVMAMLVAPSLLSLAARLAIPRGQARARPRYRTVTRKCAAAQAAPVAATPVVPAGFVIAREGSPEASLR